MADQYYHAVFVGTGLISLTAAATLAKRGKRVLLLDTKSPAENKIRDAGFGFSCGPLLYFGYEKWGTMEGYFSALAYPIPGLQEKGFSFQKIAPAPLLQVVLPKHRLNIFSDEASYFDEIKREFPSQAQKLKTLFDQISREATYLYPTLGQFQQVEAEGMAERINLWKKQLDLSQAILQQQKKKAFEMIEPLGFKKNVLDYFELFFLFAFKKPMLEVTALEMIQLFSGLQRGGVRMCGGDATLQDFFQGLIQTWEGTILKTPEISNYELEKKRMTQISLPDDTKLKADHFIVTRPSHRKKMDFYFTIPTKLIPTPMQASLVMTWGEKTPTHVENLIVVRLNTTENLERSEKCLIAISILLRENSSVSEVDRETLRKRGLERLHWLIPFSESEIKTVRHLENDEETEENFPLPPGTTEGTTKEIEKGILSYRQPKGLKNVYLIDSQQCNYLGEGSVFLAGHHLADFLEKSN